MELLEESSFGMGTLRTRMLQDRWYCSTSFSFCLRSRISWFFEWRHSLRELFSFLVSERSFSRLSNLEEKAEIVEESCSILETRAATDWGDDGGGGVRRGENGNWGRLVG